MGSYKLNWSGDEAKRQVVKVFVTRLNRAALTLKNHAKTLINVEGTGIRQSSTKAKGNRKAKRKGSLVYGANPSAPGEPPHKQTGELLRSVAFEVVGMTARVGTNKRYGRWLELGTRKIAARPWLRRAMNEMLTRLRQILAGR
jgi:hypothetical protein